jgi:hypothetical protein
MVKPPYEAVVEMKSRFFYPDKQPSNIKLTIVSEISKQSCKIGKYSPISSDNLFLVKTGSQLHE